MPTFSVTHTYERTEEDIRRIAEDPDHPLESPYRQACIQWVKEHPLFDPEELPSGSVFLHGVFEYTVLGGGKLLFRPPAADFQRLDAEDCSFHPDNVKVVFQP